jgi:hypothetical protein
MFGRILFFRERTGSASAKFQLSFNNLASGAPKKQVTEDSL